MHGCRSDNLKVVAVAKTVKHSDMLFVRNRRKGVHLDKVYPARRGANRNSARIVTLQINVASA